MANKGKKSVPTRKVVLVPVDFTPVTENAILHGIDIASSLQCPVCLLHVYNPPGGDEAVKDNLSLQVIQNRLLEYKTLFEKEYSVKVSPLIREGNLFKAVSKVVSEVKPPFMVMGTHGKQGLQQIFGSYALRMVLDCSCPVMVVQEKPAQKGYPRILLPVNSEVDPSQLIDRVMQLSMVVMPEVHLYQSLETIPDRAAAISVVATQMVRTFKEKKISCSLSVAASSHDYSGQVINYAASNRFSLVMTMTMPAPDYASGYNFSDWNERLMFNAGKIPVMFIDQADIME